MNTSPQSLVGQIIMGRYQIVRKLGSGGMGTVYQARQLSMDRMVALKIIHPRLADDPAVAARFHREMQAASVIEHVNTVRVFDFGETEGRQLFLVMEFLEGRSLADVFQDEGTLPLSRIVHIGTQIVRALGAAHQEGVVHRDLKPENVILLDRYGEHDFVKVLDFGIARFLEAGPQAPRMTVEGSVLGTPAYMSPEQAMGKAAVPASDLYSFGILLYQMATGELPFNGETLHEILIKQATKAPKPPSEIAPGLIDPALEALILDLLVKDPQQRPANAAQVASRLAACLDSTNAPLTSHTPEPLARTQVLPSTPKPPGSTPSSVPDLSSLVSSPGTSPSLPKTDIFQEAKPAKEAAPRWRRWVLPVTMVVLLAVMGLTTVIGIRLWNDRREKMAAAAMRAQLNALLKTGGSPLPPVSCQVPDTKRMAVLLRPAELLAGASAGGVHPQGSETLTLLEKAAGPNMDGVAEYWVLLARARLAIKSDPQPALDAAAAAVRLCPGYAVAQYLVGVASQLGGRLGEAWTAFERAIAAAPEYLPPRENLGQLALQKKDPVTALVMLDEILRRRPDDLQARLGRGQARLLKGDLPGALTDLQEVTMREPNRPEGWLALGHVLGKRKQWEEALSAFCKAKALGSPEAVKYCVSQ